MLLEELGFPKIEDENMDKVYVKQGYVPLEDLQAIDDIPMVTENGT